MLHISMMAECHICGPNLSDSFVGTSGFYEFVRTLSKNVFEIISNNGLDFLAKLCLGFCYGGQQAASWLY